MAALCKWDNRNAAGDDSKRVPVAIEREVAILKMIDHPNICEVFDIWENRSDM
jgi:hypothetical protein